jgi:hypothetical protein
LTNAPFAGVLPFALQTSRSRAAYAERRIRRFIPAADDDARLAGEHRDVPSSIDRRAVRTALTALAATAIVAVAAFLGARAVARDVDTGTPAHTVRDFLVTALAERNGVHACAFLTPRAEAEIAAAEPRDTPCEAAMEFARLSLGSRTVRLESTIKGLSYRAEQRGARAWVTVSSGGAQRTFALRRATRRELVEFQAPPTDWRIDSGAAALVKR